MKAFPVVVGLAAIVGLVDVAGAQGVARKQLFVEGDLVRGAQQGAPGPFCVLSNQFKRLEKVVWHEAGQLHADCDRPCRPSHH